MAGPAPPTAPNVKAIVDGDIILKLYGGDTEIGAVPKGVGLERLRFDGQKVIDLIELTAMWVELKQGIFVLHCIPLPDTQLVQMTYDQRNRLINNSGTYRILTDQEVEAAESNAIEISRNNRLLRDLTKRTAGVVLLDMIKLLYAFILAEREPNAQVGQWLNSQLADFKATFEWSALERAKLERHIAAIKERMQEYYAD